MYYVKYSRKCLILLGTGSRIPSSLGRQGRFLVGGWGVGAPVPPQRGSYVVSKTPSKEISPKTEKPMPPDRKKLPLKIHPNGKATVTINLSPEEAKIVEQASMNFNYSAFCHFCVMTVAWRLVGMDVLDDEWSRWASAIGKNDPRSPTRSEIQRERRTYRGKISEIEKKKKRNRRTDSNTSRQNSWASESGSDSSELGSSKKASGTRHNYNGVVAITTTKGGID